MTQNVKNFDPSRVLTGVVMSPNTPTTYDVWYSEQTIRDMAYDFLINGDMQNSVDLFHDLTPKQCYIVESYIARGDSEYPKGSWVVSVYIDDDDILEMVHSNKINAFSVHNRLRILPEETVTVEVKPQVTGITKRAEGHSHVFYVEYDGETGAYVGSTSVAEDGHSHKINSKGTTTLYAGEPSHIHVYDPFKKEY
jgi:hypothetical protein